MNTITSEQKKNLPYRLRESAFRVYEPYIAEAVRNLPMVTKFRSYTSAETFTHRMRDAIGSWLRFRWPTKYAWNDSNLLSLIISNKITHVLVGTKDAIKAEDCVAEEKAKKVEEKVEPFALDGSCNSAICHILAYLASNNALSRPIKFFPDHVALAELIAMEYDIDLEPLGEGWFLLT